ncbi:hypothetical protein PLESTM_002010200 [Pleodorina starrii]|nr:hypothetical protein PLESTM_002010200 [Pleodorina starrii]
MVLPAIAAQTNLGRGLCSQRRNPTSPRAIRCCCSSPESRAAALAPGAASVPPGAASAAPGAPVAAVCPSWRAAELRVRVADPRDAASLASLDAACSADGSSGWSEGIYQEDLKPGGPNLILLCELLMPPPPPPSAASSASSPLPPSSPPSQSTPPPPPPESDVLQTAAAAAATATEAGQEPRTLVVALAAGCEVAGEVSLTNLAVASEARGAGLGRRMACELLARLGSERYLTFLEVRKDNAAAQALYDRLGFVAVGVRKRYNPDGSDSLVMVRQPAPLR